MHNFVSSSSKLTLKLSTSTLDNHAFPQAAPLLNTRFRIIRSITQFHFSDWLLRWGICHTLSQPPEGSGGHGGGRAGQHLRKVQPETVGENPRALPGPAGHPVSSPYYAAWTILRQNGPNHLQSTSCCADYPQDRMAPITCPDRHATPLVSEWPHGYGRRLAKSPSVQA